MRGRSRGHGPGAVCAASSGRPGRGTAPVGACGRGSVELVRSAEQEARPACSGKRRGPSAQRERREREEREKKKREKENEKKKKKKEGRGKWRERKGGIRVDAMRPRLATRDGRVRLIAGGIRGVVYGRSATRASRGEEDGTTGVRDREMISGFEV